LNHPPEVDAGFVCGSVSELQRVQVFILTCIRSPEYLDKARHDPQSAKAKKAISITIISEADMNCLIRGIKHGLGLHLRNFWASCRKIVGWGLSVFLEYGTICDVYYGQR
jgi:hypothetical protein